MRVFVKTLIIMVLVLSLSLVFCGKKEEAMDTSPEIPKGEPPAFVDSIPAAGPLEILSYGPTSESQGQVQIKIDFPRPLIPLTTLSDEQRRQILQYFKLDPQIKGDFRFLGTSTVVFEPTQSLALASIYKVTVFRGLRDLEGYELQEDFSWEFKTLLPQITIQPSRTEPPVNIDQTIQINCNLALDLSSMEEKIVFQETVTQKGVDYRLLEHENNPDAEQDIGMGRVSYRYILKPKKDLKKNTTYTVIIQPGLLTARGNRPTERPVQANFKTFPPFEFITSKFCDGCGGNLLTQPYLSFTTRPAYKDLEKSINIDPELAENPFYTYACGSSNNIGINDYLLTPNSTYSVTLNAELKDIYGQNLENPQTITFTTGEFTPKMWGPAGYQLITPNIEPRLGIKTIKITSAFYRLLTLKPDQILVRENLNYYYSIKKLLDNIPGSPERVDISLNESDVGKYFFDLQPYLSGENYGVVAYTFRSPQVQCYDKPIEFNGLILRTNLGIYAQLHPTAGMIKINQLTDGAPIAGARIKIYREDDLPQLDKIWDLIRGTIPTKPQPCFSGISDANGLLYFEGKDVAACTKRLISNKVLNELYPPEADPDDVNYDRERFGFAHPPRLLIVAEKGNDWTFLQTETYGNPSIWQFGVITDWESERPISRGTLFSDHYIYRPGDIVKMKGISRYLLFGKMFSGKGNQYTIKLRDPMGAEKELGKVKVSEFGTFNIDIPTREGQSLGYYQVVAETPYKELRFYGEFRLAEFRVPEFEVTLQADKKIAVAGESIDLDWEGKYYFGAPMAKASSSLNITRRKTYFRPAGWETYTFGVPDYLEERQVSLSGTFLKETIELNASGLGEKSVRFREDDVPFPMTYRFDVEVEDVSRQTIAANQSSTLLPDERLIGLNVSNWIVAADDTVDLSVIVSSPQGKLLEKIPVTVKLMKREYHSVKTETPDGRFTTEHNVVTKTVESKEVNSGNQPVPVMFIPPEAGSYVIRAELKKKPDSGTAAATSLWVSGRDYVPWEDRGEDRLEMIMDKKEYEIGDQATVFIKSPFPKAELLISTGREKIFQKEILKIEGSAYTFTFQITEEMLPNAYVTAALFRIGDPIVPVEEEVGKHMERIGITAFQVSSDSKYLSVTVTPDRLKARPAEEITVQLQVKNVSGAGHRSELTVIVVDEAVLALTGYSPPDLVKTVYAFRGYSGRINDNRPFIITEEQLLQKGTGYGGGMLGGVADPRVRKEFLKLAHYQPSLITDKDGKALFKFKLPDNLTTWRIMAVAVGEKDLFGYGEEKLVSTQPFILRAILPRFARIGDQFLSGVAITNLTEVAGQVSVESTIEGKSVIAGERKAKQTGIRIKPGESKAVLFPFRAGLAGDSQLKFTAFFQGVYDGQNISESDALQVPLEIMEPLVTETVVSVGETTDNFTQQIKVDESVRRDVGGLQMLVSSTALTNIGEGAKYLVEYPYGCLEQTSSRLLALLQLKFLSEKYQFTLQAVKPVEKVIQANIRKILLLQNFDGGFKFWPNSDRSDCYLTPYVAYLISRSQKLGYEFPEPVKKNLKNYLDQILRNPCYPLGSWKALAEYRLNILRGLYALGNLDETYFEEYFNRRNDLSLGAQIQLAYLLAQSARWKPEAGKILTELKNAVFTTAQTAYFESPRSLPPSWLFMYSPIITTADGIKLFLELEPDSPYITKFSRYILNARRNGRWRNTFENAHAIDALVEISRKREAIPPDYTAAIQLAGEEVLKHLFKGYQYQPQEGIIPMAELPAGLNDLVVSKDGKGILYYTLSYSYRLKGPQPARHEGFSIKRTVRNADKDRDLLTYGDEPQDRLEVKAGDILEVVLEFKVPQTGYHLVIDDPIPAGLEAIDASLKTTSARYGAPSQQRQTRGRSDARGYSWSPINHTELRDDRVALFAEAVQAGNYTYRYMLRATTAGTFLWPAAKISLMYEPEQFGTCSEGFVEVEE